MGYSTTHTHAWMHACTHTCTHTPSMLTHTHHHTLVIISHIYWALTLWHSVCIIYTTSFPVTMPLEQHCLIYSFSIKYKESQYLWNLGLPLPLYISGQRLLLRTLYPCLTLSSTSCHPLEDLVRVLSQPSLPFSKHVFPHNGFKSFILHLEPGTI